MLNHSLRELAGLFLRIGLTAFGGPAAHIAMMEEEVVRRKQWMTRQQFLDLVGATNLIPGPNSTEMAIHIGYRRAGWAGLVVAGACFIVPAAILVACLAWAYVRCGRMPQAAALLYGVKPVVFAIVLRAMWRLARAAVKTPLLGVVGVASLGLALLGAGELAILAAAGTLLGFVRWFHSGSGRKTATALVLGAIAMVTLAAEFLPGASLSQRPPTLNSGTIFLYFAKTGSVLYGSGYVLLAFLQTDLVAHWHWLTARQLLDAVAAGQVTPGPLFTTATFIGYILAGPMGALCATAGIFLPAFFFCAISGPLVPRVRRSAVAGAFLDGVNVASLALMGGVTWALARAAVVDVVAAVLAAASALILFRYRVNSGWLVLGGAAAGLLLARPAW
ncbi:MAG: chromate efflux transporter [Bryobacteraceae bacterium]